MEFLRSTPIKDLIKACDPLVESFLGDIEKEVTVFTALHSTQPGSFIFINSLKMLDEAINSQALCILAPKNAEEKVNSSDTNKIWLFSRNPELAAQMIKKALVFPTPYRAKLEGVHPTAIVSETADLDQSVVVGPHAFIGDNTKIGAGSFVGANAVVEQNVTIKENVTIHPLAYIGHSCEIGNNCEIMPQAIIGSEGYGYAHDHLGNHYRIPHTGRVILHDDVHIGAGTAIDRGTIDDSVVGTGTKLDNQCHFAHNTVIGRNGLVTAQAVTAGSSTIGDNFMCGGKTAITGHIQITDNVNVAGLSGITNSVREPGQYGGYPLIPLKQHLKVAASGIHLPELRKQMNRVLRKVFPEDFEK